jgi:hypothetical protein
MGVGETAKLQRRSRTRFITTVLHLTLFPSTQVQWAPFAYRTPSALGGAAKHAAASRRSRIGGAARHASASRRSRTCRCAILHSLPFTPRHVLIGLIGIVDARSSSSSSPRAFPTWATIQPRTPISGSGRLDASPCLHPPDAAKVRHPADNASGPPGCSRNGLCPYSFFLFVLHFSLSPRCQPWTVWDLSLSLSRSVAGRISAFFVMTWYCTGLAVHAQTAMTMTNVAATAPATPPSTTRNDIKSLRSRVCVIQR